MQDNNFNINDDDFIIGKGFNVEEPQAEEKRKHGKRAKKGGNSTIKNIIWIICIIVVSVGLAITLIFAGADYLGIGFGRGEDCEMDIPYGASTTAIAESLENTGAVKMPMLFRLYSKLKGYESQYKYGLYTFNTEIGYEKIAEMLMTDGKRFGNYY